MFSLTWIYQYLGNNNIPDWVEQAAFNALPVAISPDWWSHQYVQQENQPWSRNLTQGTKGLWTNGGPLGQRLWLGAGLCNISCLLPLFPPQRKTLIKHPQPCCTVNHPQAYPKFLANSFALTEDGGIAHVFLGPAALRTTLADGNKASITAETAYPFGFEITYTISSTKLFPFFIRLPDWVVVSASSLSVNPATSTSPKLSSLMRSCSGQAPRNYDPSIQQNHNQPFTFHHAPSPNAKQDRCPIRSTPL